MAGRPLRRARAYYERRARRAWRWHERTWEPAPAPPPAPARLDRLPLLPSAAAPELQPEPDVAHAALAALPAPLLAHLALACAPDLAPTCAHAPALARAVLARLPPAQLLAHARHVADLPARAALLEALTGAPATTLLAAEMARAEQLRFTIRPKISKTFS